MIKSKLPKEQYEMIPASFIREAINGYNAMALREEDSKMKEYLFLRAEVLRDLLKSWIIRTVAQEPDVIDAAKKAYRDAVDSFALDDVETLIQTFKG